MLVALTSKSVAEILLSIALVPFPVGYLIRRRRRLQLSWLLARGGRAALSDKGRAKLVKRGFDIPEIEVSIAENFELNDGGEIVLSDAGCEAVNGGTGEALRLGRRQHEKPEKSAKEK